MQTWNPDEPNVRSGSETVNTCDDSVEKTLLRNAAAPENIARQ